MNSSDFDSKPAEIDELWRKRHLWRVNLHEFGKSHHHVAIMTAQITCLSLSLPGVVKITLDDANLIADAELVFDTKLV